MLPWSTFFLPGFFGAWWLFMCFLNRIPVVVENSHFVHGKGTLRCLLLTCLFRLVLYRAEKSHLSQKNRLPSWWLSLWFLRVYLAFVVNSHISHEKIISSRDGGLISSSLSPGPAGSPVNSLFSFKFSFPEIIKFLTLFTTLWIWI